MLSFVANLYTVNIIPEQKIISLVILHSLMYLFSKKLGKIQIFQKMYRMISPSSK